MASGGTKTRDPVAYIGEDDYFIVVFTHDEALARDALLNEMRSLDMTESIAFESLTKRTLRSKKVWARKVPALPNSYAAAQGWAFSWHEYDKPSRGASLAVVFR